MFWFVGLFSFVVIVCVYNVIFRFVYETIWSPVSYASIKYYYDNVYTADVVLYMCKQHYSKRDVNTYNNNNNVLRCV